ncbi:MAG TPA: ABC transporter ATP-binding protein [Hyphomicrobiaceae bacterium]|nr:ABC transporter ATP-binding protein [Hyphomicrobiaceae bacterium]
MSTTSAIAAVTPAPGPPEAPILAVRNLEAWYGRGQVLFGVGLEIAPGEAVVLIGRNGAGKSTTMRAIMRLVPRSAGEVLLDGVPVQRLPTHEIARAGIGYVPEERRIFTELTVDENLEVGRLPAREGHAWTPAELFELFPNLGRMRNRRGGAMSGGEQQMLTIARSLMGNPRCLLLDEPSEGLAPVIIEGIAEAIAALKTRGVALLLSEQNLHFARLIASRVYVIERGEIRFSGTIAELDANAAIRDQYLAV